MGISKYRVSEFLQLEESIEHWDIVAWDEPPVTHNPFQRIFGTQLAACEHLAHVASIDASRLGLGDDDVIGLVASPYFKPRWLDLSGNTAITEKSIQYICHRISTGQFHLDWLDLTATKCDATPYLDGEDYSLGAGKDVWRMPLLGHKLARMYGPQRWMTLCYPINEEAEQYVEIAEFYKRGRGSRLG
tara:strand:+ start:403 stop:966 length:564 start_codon:yes stop_codon:yes gene_type:complete